VVRHGRVVAETEPSRSVVHQGGASRAVTFEKPASEGGHA
jgi:hypothetical protein